MSAPTLPLEILDLIFDLVQPKSSLPTRESTRAPFLLNNTDTVATIKACSQQSLASLARTSKQFVSPARIRLYSRPLVENPSFPWFRASDLANTLMSSSLGRLVVTLQGIAPSRRRLANFPPPPTTPRITGCTESTTWYLTILQACPQLHEVDIYFESREELDRIDTALSVSGSTPQNVTFTNLHEGSLPPLTRLTSDSVKRTLARRPFRNVERVRLENIKFTGTTRITNAIKHLQLHDSGFSDVHLNGFNLVDLSRFESLHLAAAFTDFRALLISLAPSLRYLDLTRNYARPECRPTLASYSRFISRGPHPADLPPLANLTSITAQSKHFNWIQALVHLATSSPRLEVIDFHGSRWILPGTPMSDQPASLNVHGTACSEDELITALGRFKKLSKVDLGGASH